MVTAEIILPVMRDQHERDSLVTEVIQKTPETELMLQILLGYAAGTLFYVSCVYRIF